MRDKISKCRFFHSVAMQLVDDVFTNATITKSDDAPEVVFKKLNTCSYILYVGKKGLLSSEWTPAGPAKARTSGWLPYHHPLFPGQFALLYTWVGTQPALSIRGRTHPSIRIRRQVFTFDGRGVRIFFCVWERGEQLWITTLCHFLREQLVC